MEEIDSFGEWVQKRRNQLRYSRTDLAKLVVCSPETIKKIERDERRPSLEIAELLAKHLLVPETEQAHFIRKGRGGFVVQFGAPKELSWTESQQSIADAPPAQTTLPTPTTPFIGRESELNQIEMTLADPSCRLLTILGAGGMGKTRLSIAVAQKQIDKFTDGVLFVPLAPIQTDHFEDDINPLVTTLADKLGITFYSGTPPKEQIFEHLRRKEILLLLDNYEHLVDTADFLSQLLSKTRDVKILVTSRERLNLQEEWIFSLQGMGFSQKEDSKEPNAVILFNQRAKQNNPDFDRSQEHEQVLEICQLVEGMPLGIELAAAWCRQFSCAEIVAEIKEEIDFLTSTLRNLPERHRSIRIVFSHSWQILSAKEQDVLKKLSVFRGGFDLKAAKAISGASNRLLLSLVDKSFVQIREHGRNNKPSIYTIHELLRQFSAEKLAQDHDENTAVHHQHCLFYLDLLEKTEPTLSGPHGLEAVQAIRLNWENINLALQWSSQFQPHLLSRLVAYVLLIYFDFNGKTLEGVLLFSQLAKNLDLFCSQSDIKSTPTHPPVEHLALARMYLYAAFEKLQIGRHQETEIDRIKGHSLLSGTSLDVEFLSIQSKFIEGALAFHKGDAKKAQTYLAEAAQRGTQAIAKLNQPSGLMMQAVYSNYQTMIAQLTGEYDKAEEFTAKSLDIVNQLDEQLYRSYCYSQSGRTAMYRGELQEAKSLIQLSLEQRISIDLKPGIPVSLIEMGQIAQLEGRIEDALDFFQRSVAHSREINVIAIEARGLWWLGNLAVDAKDFSVADEYFKKSLQLAPIFNIGGPGWAFLGLNTLIDASEFFKMRLQLMLSNKLHPIGLDAVVGLAALMAKVGEFEQALSLLALAEHHPSTQFGTKLKGRKLRKEVASELPDLSVTSAEQRGKVLNLQETAVALINNPLL